MNKISPPGPTSDHWKNTPNLDIFPFHKKSWYPFVRMVNIRRKNNLPCILQPHSNQRLLEGGISGERLNCFPMAVVISGFPPPPFFSKQGENHFSLFFFGHCQNDLPIVTPEMGGGHKSCFSARSFLYVREPRTPRVVTE